jgi:hypothetical protein
MEESTLLTPGSQDPFRRSGFQISQKAKLLLPLIGTVAALLVFLLLVWPEGRHHHKAGNGAQARHEHGAERGSEDSRGAGWRPDKPEKTAKGNTAATGDRVASEDRSEKGAVKKRQASEETWWYHDDRVKKNEAPDEHWWYHD